MKPSSIMCKDIMLLSYTNHGMQWFFVYRDCLGLCFQHLVQKDLDRIKAEWNSHRIRANRSSSCPSGYPNELYFLPGILGSISTYCV